jgi:hypothetical protein
MPPNKALQVADQLRIPNAAAGASGMLGPVPSGGAGS